MKYPQGQISFAITFNFKSNVIWFINSVIRSLIWIKHRDWSDLVMIKVLASKWKEDKFSIESDFER